MDYFVYHFCIQFFVSQLGNAKQNTAFQRNYAIKFVTTDTVI